MAPISKGAINEPIKLMLDKIVSAMPIGVLDLSPTKLYSVGTIHDMPSPTSMNPKELIMTFHSVDSIAFPNNADRKKPIKMRLPAICNTVFLPKRR